MKMTRYIVTAVVAGSMMFGFSSCNKDKEDPTVTFHQPFIEDMHYMEGTWFKLEAYIDDDAGLTNYEVYLTDSAGTNTGTIQGMNFDINFEAEVTGTGFLHRDSIVIPNGVGSWYNGSYKVNVIAKDAEGKEVVQQRRFFVDP